MGLEINKVRDLCSIYQDDRGTGPNGKQVPTTAFAAIHEQENAYFGKKSGISMCDLTADIVRECLRPLPDEKIYPILSPNENLTVAPDDIMGFPTSSKPTPIPTLSRYHGCRVKRGRIRGLVLETFAFQYDIGLVKIRPDLFKANIMFGDGGEPKLIDFGSCEPFGERLTSAGAPGWCRNRSQAFASDKANDEHSLGLLGPWLIQSRSWRTLYRRLRTGG
ncbi:hypothetical protein N657DRAFT_673947 [Parathielavia appendiculata]|uniref:Protein kinase domain-containing protein n=1 Tax=Parathielavia appendiculata TaxID=2587402 RepID=A0AAN6TU86_9PEZI|nr:hypothetical protein N657DRAFT_673947 [Parathielavia appendiculata]